MLGAWIRCSFNVAQAASARRAHSRALHDLRSEASRASALAPRGQELEATHSRDICAGRNGDASVHIGIRVETVSEGDGNVGTHSCLAARNRRPTMQTGRNHPPFASRCFASGRHTCSPSHATRYRRRASPRIQSDIDGADDRRHFSPAEAHRGRCHRRCRSAFRTHHAREIECVGGGSSWPPWHQTPARGNQVRRTARRVADGVASAHGARSWRPTPPSSTGRNSRRESVFLGRPDLYYEDEKLGIEYDGSGHRNAMVADNHRQNNLLGVGVRLLRFTAPDVLDEPASVVECVRAQLRNRC